MGRIWMLLFLVAVLAVARSVSYANGGRGGGGRSMGGYSGSNSSGDYSAYEKSQEIQGLYQKGVEAGNDGDYAKALNFFQEALKLDSNNADVLNMLAHAQRMTGHLDEALENYKKALQLKPDFAEAREYLGEAYLQAAVREMDTLKGYGDKGQEQLKDLQDAFKAETEKLKSAK